MKTLLKIASLNFILICSFSQARISENLQDFIKSQSFKQVLKKCDVSNFKIDKVNEVKFLKDINTHIYSCESTNVTVYILENCNVNKFQVYISKNDMLDSVIFNSQGNRVVSYAIDSDRKAKEIYILCASTGEEDGDIVVPNPECVKQTVDVIKAACNSDGTCAMLCDLMDVACKKQTYIIAAAYCATHNNNGPQDVSTSTK